MRTSKFERREIIAWDGEGINRTGDGKHVYSLLANSSGEFRINDSGLSTDDCFRFILEWFQKRPRAIHIIFGGSYDFGMMMFQGMKRNTVEKIWKGADEYGTKWREWSVSYVPRKHLSLREFGYPPFSKGKPNIVARGTLWDVFPFFQCSFVRAIEKWLGSDYPDLSLIREGKKLRGAFTAEQLKTIILPYTQAELKALVLLYSKLLGSVQQAGLTLSRHDGPGALASCLLKQNGIKDKKTDETGEMAKIFSHGFFGGRVELLKYGHHEGRIYNYDVNSAYPYAMLGLPNLSQGEWRKGEHGSAFAISLVEWNFRNKVSPFFPFPFREREGNVLFPPQGRNWVWRPELEVAHETGFQYKILETWSFVASSEEKPFAFVKDKYSLRKQWKTEGNPAENAMKLALNSLYGKLAQQVGYNEKTKRKPPYHSYAWAGYITSFTRAMVLRAALRNAKSILFFATDGIFSLEPLSMPCGDSLGDWTEKIYDEVVSVQSGVYFVRKGTEWFEKTRGFDAELKPVKVLDAWLHRAYESFFPSTTFFGVGRAVQTKETWNERGTWKTIQRRLALTPWGTKRLDCHGGKTPLWISNGGVNPQSGLVDTIAAPSQDGYLKGVIPMSHEKSLLWQEHDPVFQYEWEHEESFL
jgi:DNA polymerase type B, organellar and viral